VAATRFGAKRNLRRIMGRDERVWIAFFFRARGGQEKSVSIFS